MVSILAPCRQPVSVGPAARPAALSGAASWSSPPTLRVRSSLPHPCVLQPHWALVWGDSTGGHCSTWSTVSLSHPPPAPPLQAGGAWSRGQKEPCPLPTAAAEMSSPQAHKSSSTSLAQCSASSGFSQILPDFTKTPALRSSETGLQQPGVLAAWAPSRVHPSPSLGLACCGAEHR